MCESRKAEVTLAVVQAVVVNVVDNEMVRGASDLAVHFDAFAGFFSNGVVVLRCTFRKPGKLAQARVVFGIDNGELSAGQRYEAWPMVLSAGDSRRIKVWALIEKGADIPLTFRTFFLPTDKSSPAGARGKG